MKRILKREYTAEFREQAVAMVNNGRSVPEVAQELGLITLTLPRFDVHHFMQP